MHGLNKYIFAAFCLFLLTAFFSQTAIAQFEGTDRRLRNAPVSERVPDDLRAEGLAFKGFVYRPSLVVSAEYIDNVLASPDNKLSDYLVSVQPGLKIVKKYDGHEFFIAGTGNIERFSSRSEENKEEYNLRAGGLLDLNSRWSIPFFVRKAMVKRNRQAPRDTKKSEEPLGINILESEVGIIRKFNRLSLKLEGVYEERTFDNGAALNGSEALIFSDSDRQIYTGRVGAEYELSRSKESEHVEHILFGDLEYSRNLYERLAFTGTSFSGDSGSRKRIGALAGFQTQYKGLLFARLGAGFYSENFDQADLDTVTSFDFSADVEYSPLSKLMLRFQAGRDVNQDNGFISGVEVSEYLLGLDYELLHNLYFESDFSYTNFDILESEREDKDWETELRIRYLNSRNLSTNFAFGYQDRSSTDPDAEFENFNFMIYLKSQL